MPSFFPSSSNSKVAPQKFRWDTAGIPLSGSLCREDYIQSLLQQIVFVGEEKTVHHFTDVLALTGSVLLIGFPICVNFIRNIIRTVYRLRASWYVNSPRYILYLAFGKLKHIPDPISKLPPPEVGAFKNTASHSGRNPVLVPLLSFLHFLDTAHII